MLPEKLNRKEIYKSKWVNLYVDKVKMPSGKILDECHILDYPKEAVVVLLTNSKGELCFIESIRYPTHKIEWEIPAGGIDGDESILETASREVFEETGYKSTSLELIYSFNPNNALSNQFFHVVLGNLDEKQKQANFDTDEVKAVHWFSIKKVKELIAKNAINDGTSLIALLLYTSGIVEHKTNT